MPQYFYRAIDAAGQRVEGEMDAERLADAIVQLESRQWQVEEVRAISSSSTGEAGSSAGEAGIEHVESAVLQQELESAIQQRDQLVPALEALADELPPGTLRRDLRDLIQALQNAESAADLKQRKRLSAWLPLLAVGLTRKADTHRLADLIRMSARQNRIRHDRQSILMYPAVLALLALGIFAVLCTLVVPTFEEMFVEFGLSLPASTQMLIFFSRQIRYDPLLTLAMLIAAAAILYGLAWLWLRHSIGTRYFYWFAAGNSSNVAAMASLSSQLAELISIDVPLPDALRVAGQGCGHYHYEKVAARLADDASHAGVLLSSSPVAGQLPANLLYALQPSGDRGPSVPLLRELAAMYSERSGHRIDWVSGAVAHFAIIAIGLAVGFVVIALFSPLVQLVSGLS